jgi:filamentous hemagglutinin family protein
MASSWQCWCSRFGLASSLFLGGAIASSGDYALAQIIPDTTLGNQNSTVKPISPTVDQINGGATRGANLFHSFQEFNVGEGRSVYFTNPVGIQNILTRVTGTNPSNILGTFGVTGGNANLFVINPNGIIFGQNASLNVGGSFAATTANAIGFGDRGVFSASAPEAPSLLTVNPNAFVFNQIAARAIVINSRRLLDWNDHSGKSLLFVGGDVSMNGGDLFAPGAHLELGGLAGSGTIGLNVNSNKLRSSFPDGVARTNIQINNTYIDTGFINNAEGSGIIISAQNLDISDSYLAIGAPREGNAGNLSLHALGSISIEDSFFINSTNGKGNAGSILLHALGSISIEDSYFYSQTWGDGNTGNIFVQALGSISFKSSSISVYRGYDNTFGEGNTGNILLQAQDSISVDNSHFESNTVKGGNTGNILLQALGSISVDKSEFSSSNFLPGNDGNGNILLQAHGSISFDNSRINTSFFGDSDAGSISLQAHGSISIDYSFLSTSTSGAGKGGDITIQAQSLSLINGTQLSASTSGKGNAGNIQIYAKDSVTISGDDPLFRYSTGVSTNTWPTADGRGGDITIETGALRILDGALVSAASRNNSQGGNITANVNTLEISGGGQMLATAFNNGNAGKITVNANESITLSGSDPTYFDRLAQRAARYADVMLTVQLISYIASDSPISGIFSNTVTNSTGRGGNIELRTEYLNVRDGAQVNVSSNGSGNAGELRVEANSILLNNQAKLQASTISGEGGNINLQVQDLILMRRNSSISAEARGTANGGNATIKAPFIVAVPSEDIDIIAKAERGRGGNINITTNGIYGLEYHPKLTPLSDINASSEFGVNGTVQINTPDVDPSRGLTNLPTEVIDPSNQIDQTCAAGGKAAQNEFIITGRGGLPPNPREPLSQDAIQVDWVTLHPRRENPSRQTVSVQATSTTPAPLVEAQGWEFDIRGNVVLTADPTTVTPHRSSLNSPNCHS